MSGARTVEVLTLDRGPVALPEPSWCAGHTDEVPGHQVDFHHSRPLDVPQGLVDLDAELVEFPFGRRPVALSVYVEIVAPGATLDPDGLREFAADLTARAALLVEFADRLATLRAGGDW
ncbi:MULTISPECIES: hypothetical protein [unclassified Streptomyces]|uniref:DUF6907 domain-containing protein n=1 Tax=unclassified Streptomyces TaxID=2593676 RepID=UPI000DC76B43|nr:MULTISPECIES: hypothetical protein [unclassified Streptomyces]AWZ05636.1 hypothetical protein DRB89_14305 [Streptomyces sp. ICC4]AWZ13316.1 hypothetical protein DRB96_14435 [Streptomyces sp. ICC1]